MPVKDARGGYYVDDTQYYKHIFTCNCGWVKVIVSSSKTVPEKSADKIHGNQRPSCKNWITYKKTKKTKFGHPDNFREDTD